MSAPGARQRRACRAACRGDEAHDDRQGPSYGRSRLCRRARASGSCRTTIAAALAAADQARRAGRGRRGWSDISSRDTTHISVIDGQRQCGRADPHARQPVGRDHRRARLHVQRHDEPLRSAAGTRRLDRAGQAARELGGADHRLQGRSIRSIVMGAPGGSYIAPADGAGPDERDRFRHEHVGGGGGAAHRRGLERDRRLQPHSTLRHRRDLDAQGMRSSVRRRATPSPRCTGFASHGARLEGGADPQRDGMALAVRA